MGFGNDIDYWDSEDIRLSREAGAQFRRILYDADYNVKEMLEYLFP